MTSDDDLFDVNKLFNYLTSIRKLERDKSIDFLNKLFVQQEHQHQQQEQRQDDELDNNNERGREFLFVVVQHKLIDCLNKSIFVDNIKWEFKFGLLNAICVFILHKKQLKDDFDYELTRNYAFWCLNNDNETRVRQAAGELLGVLCRVNGDYVEIENKLIELISKHIDGDIKKREEKQKYKENKRQMRTESMAIDSDSGSDSDSDSCDSDDSDLSDYEPTIDTNDYELNDDGIKIIKKLSINATTDPAKLYRTLAGWRHLETSMKAFQCCVDGHSKYLKDEKRCKFMTENVFDLIYKTTQNRNRYVRETSFDLLSTIFTSICVDLVTANNCTLIATHLSNGLSDSWSQVRLVASIATRNYLLHLNDELRERYIPIVLPAMCFNRYFLADGVKLYSQETWKLIFKENGRQYVENNLDAVVEYYLKQIEISDNPTVREVSCACISELAAKMNRTLLEPYVKKLVKMLVYAFNTHLWTVRDASCLALGNMFLYYPNEIHEQINELYNLFKQNLNDSILSVREGAALSIANMLRSYESIDQKLVESYLQEIEVNFKNSIENVEKNQTNKKLLNKMNEKGENEEALYTPYMTTIDTAETGKKSKHKKRHKRRKHVDQHIPTTCDDDIGSIEAQSNEPWHQADGHLYLINELSNISKSPLFKNYVLKQFDSIHKLLKLRHYIQHVNVLQTFCKIFVLIGKNMGKNEFKSILEKCFEPIFYTLDCDYEPASQSANDCLVEISKFIGPNILIGRLDNFDSRLVDKLQRVLSAPQRHHPMMTTPAAAAGAMFPGVNRKIVS